MKSLFLFFFSIYTSLFFSQVKTETKIINQSYCCYYNFGSNPVIPKLEDLKCKNDVTKNNLYSFFPQIINYKGFIFSKIIFCDESPHASLGFLYCNPKSHENIKIKITDFNDSFFKTNVGVHAKDIYLAAFTPEGKKAGNSKTQIINNFDLNTVNPSGSPSGFYHDGEKSPYASFNGYYKNRYLIQILIRCNDNRLNKPKKVEKFLIDYINQMNF